MKTVCFINKYNGIVKTAEKLSSDFFIASFDSNEENANFIPDKIIESSTAGSLFVEKVVDNINPDLVIFSDETLVREAASVFGGRKNLGIISHSNELYRKYGKIVGRVPGWENLSAEVSSLTLPYLIILKGEEKINISEHNMVPKKIFIGENEEKLTLVKIHKGNENPLRAARIIVGIGRGVNVNLIPDIKAFANRIKAEIGCTRPVADMGILPNFRMIGDSGINVHPDIYIAFGVSGAIQHLSGVNAKYIIAVNKDPKAPIFSEAALAINTSVEDALTDIKKWLKNFSL